MAPLIGRYYLSQAADCSPTRGRNHDRYGVTGHASATNLFLNHSASGRSRRGRVFSHPVGDMLVVGLDLSPMPGPNRPANFLGVMHQVEPPSPPSP